MEESSKYDRQKRYVATEKGHAALKKAQQKYAQTERGKQKQAEANKRYYERKKAEKLAAEKTIDQTQQITETTVPNKSNPKDEIMPDSIPIFEGTNAYRFKSDGGSHQSIAFILYQIDQGQLDLSPEYQRNEKVGKWNKELAKEAVESIYDNTNVGELKFSRRIEGGKLYVIDGKQRLTSIKSFVNGIFPINIDGEKVFHIMPKIKPKYKYSVFSEKSLKEFLDIKISVRTYLDMTVEKERIIFRKVQNGVRLSPGEQIFASDSVWHKFTQELNEKYGAKLEELYGSTAANERKISIRLCNDALAAIISGGNSLTKQSVTLDYFDKFKDHQLTEKIKAITQLRIENIMDTDEGLTAAFVKDNGKLVRRRCQQTFYIMLVIFDSIYRYDVKEEDWATICEEILSKHWYLSSESKKRADSRHLKLKDIRNHIRREVERLGYNVGSFTNQDDDFEDDNDSDDETDDLENSAQKRKKME